MPAVTSSREIDRKLHRIVHEADSAQFRTALALGRKIEGGRHPEFAYHRAGRTEHANAITVAQYVLYAKYIGLLSADLEAARPKEDIRSLDAFQRWLGDVVLRFLRANNASLDDIRDACDVLSVFIYVSSICIDICDIFQTTRTTSIHVFNGDQEVLH